MTRNDNCTLSCKTQDHSNYGDCIRQNIPMFNGVTPTKDGWDQSKVKRDEKELNAYYSAVKQGMEPRSTRMEDIKAAEIISNEGGKAFDGTTLTFKE